MRRTLLLSTVALILSTQAVTAQDPENANLPAKSTTWTLHGVDDRRGTFMSDVTVDAATRAGDGSIEVVRIVWFSAGEPSYAMHRGYGRLQEGVIHVELKDRLGLTGRLSERATAPIFLTISIQPDGRMDTVIRSADGNGTAKGHPRTEGSTERPRRAETSVPASASRDEAHVAAASAASDDDSGGIIQRGRHLIAVSLRKLKDHARGAGENLAFNGASLDEDFGISNYFHVGIGGRVHALEPTELTAEQQFTSRRRPRHVWISSKVHGGVRIPLSTSIPVGSVSISVGLAPGASVDYEVIDIYPIPRGFDREGLKTLVADLETVAKRSFDLPLDAAEAERMNVGAKRVFDGEASVAISGSLSVGYDVADIGEVVRIGASARVGGFYRISGDVRVTVERLLGSRVRIRVRRGETRSHGFAAEALVGATLDTDWLRKEIQPGVEYVDEALLDTAHLPTRVREAIVGELEDRVVDEARGKVRKVLRFQISANSSKSVRDEVDISYACDLRSQKARAAYERAVRGDFTRLAMLAIEPGSGVEQEFRVLEVEETTHLGAFLKLSVLLDAAASRDITLKDISVEDQDGQTKYEVFRFNRKRRFDLGSIKRRKEMTAEVIRRERDGQVERTLRLTVEVLDPYTFKREGLRIQRLLASWGLDASSSLPNPEFEFGRTRFGETRLKLRALISDAGLRGILSASDDRVFQAYVNGFTALEGKVPLWATAAGRETIRDDANEDRSRQYEVEQRELNTATAFVRSMQRMRRANDGESRADALERLAKSSKFDHYVLAALIELAPRETVDLAASFMGERVALVDARETGVTAVVVDDPR